MTDTKELMKKLTYTRKNFWKENSEDEKKKAFLFAEDYKHFLDEVKTEREATVYFSKLLENNGFVSLDNDHDGKKIYRLAKEKNAAAAVLESGIHKSL